MNKNELEKITALEITDDEFNQISRYVELLLMWNSKINLISRKNDSSPFLSHILPALLFAQVIDLQNKNILDLGSGGGLPGIPLSILFEKSSFTLLDSIQKKVSVLDEIVKSLSLKNVFCVCERVENIKIKHAKNKFDIVVARGVATIKTLVGYSLPLVNGKQILLTLKGGDLTLEKNEALRSFPYIKITEIPVSEIINNTNILEDKKFILVERK
mgnify:FL=1